MPNNNLGNAQPPRRNQQSPQRSHQQRPQGAPQRAQARRGASGSIQNVQPVKNVKMKPPVSKGGTIAISMVVSFIMLLIFALGLIMVATARTSSEQAAYQQTLSDSINQVKEAAIDVAFAPAESLRKQASDPNVNITCEKDGTADKKAESSGERSGASGNQADTQKQAEGEQQQSTTNAKQSADANTDQNKKTTVYGAGVVISTNNTTSYILTNYHVVEGSKNIKCKISDTTYDADLLGWDSSSDLCVLTVQVKGLAVAKIGKSGNVKQGDYTMSIGNPYGLNDTMTTGIISGLDRNFTMKSSSGNTIMYADMFQTDAPISPGNSGGGMYNANGELIGINTLVSGADDSHADSYGYAIPIDLAIPIAQNLMAEKAPAHPSLGVSVSDVSNDTVQKYGLKSSDGAYIVNITPSGPAETTGIVQGDVITSFGGEKVTNAQDLLFKIRASVINEQKEIKVLREGKEMTFTIKIGSDA